MSKHPRKAFDRGVRQDWLLYLLREVEIAIERNSDQWDAEVAKAAHKRLERITAETGKVAAKRA
jgi:hypothetical protein